jgi:hypothetical protein
MANRKTFNDFEETLPTREDYVIGFAKPEPGGERRFRLSALKGLIHTSDIVKVTGAVDFSAEEVINGKIYHVAETDGSTENEISVSLPASPDRPMQFGVVNMSTHKAIRISTRIGTPLQARGEVLRRKFDTATIYWDGANWSGYGDLARDGGLGIKDIVADYDFSITDADAFIHVRASADIKINLPNPTNIISGTQFYIYNLSDTAKVILNSTSDAELLTRANVLRKKYDDAVVYTDGTSWFATGDLS